MSTRKRNSIWRFVVPAGFVLYIVGASYAALLFRHRYIPTNSIFDLQAMYGPLVKNILTSHLYASPDMMFTGHRMPFIPYFLAAIAALHNDVFLAYVVKNLVFFSLTLSGLLAWRSASGGVSGRTSLMTIFALCSFPQFIFWATSPDIDEGYVIHLLAALCIGLFCFERVVRDRKWMVLALLGVLNALLYLTKSSMLLVSVSMCLLYWFRSADLRVLSIFGGLLLGAVALWGWMNVERSGTFAVGTSLDGWNLYKGNNAAAVLLYPTYNLDIADDEGLMEFNRPPGMDEWDFSRAARGKAVEFALTHPLDELRLMGRRLFVFFLEVRRNPLYRGESQFESPVYWLGTLFMAAFRFVFLGSLWRGGRRLWSYVKGPRPRHAGEINDTIVFFTVLTAYALPYLMGFMYERHLMPLVIPTVIYWFASGFTEPGRRASSPEPAAHLAAIRPPIS